MREKFIHECKIIEQNCTYTAEAHHIIASRSKRLLLWLEIIPAITAALSGVLVAGKVVPDWFIWLSIIAAVITAVSSVLNPLKSYYEHLNAAKNFIALKHDARILKDATGFSMDDNAFMEAVKGLHQTYNELLKFVPPTDKRSFEQARQNIQQGIHEPDK